MTEDEIATETIAGPGPWAQSVSYDVVTDEVRLVLESGITVIIPRGAIPELRDAPASHMNDLALFGDGEVLESSADDVHLLVPGLLWDLIGFDQPVPCWNGTPAPKPNGRKGHATPN
jgi:hypothetical protein